MKSMRPIVLKFFDHWRFVYPEDMKTVSGDFWDAVEFLGVNENECQKRLKKIINQFPECHIDAYIHLSLSYGNQNKRHESLHYALTAYLIGKNSFPKEFDITKDTIRWGVYENRTFLQSCQTLGLEFQLRKNYNRAIEIYEENLNYNENDNQGIRYFLLDCYFHTKQYSNIKALFKKYPDEWGIDFIFGEVLLDILTNKSQKAETLLRRVVNKNPFVLDEVLKTEHIPPPVSDEPLYGIPIGSVYEAYDYWYRYHRIFRLKKIQTELKRLKLVLAT